MVAATAVPAQPAHAMPTYRGHPLLGAFPEIAKDQLALLVKAHAQQGETFRLPVWPIHAVVVTNPADVQRVLVDNARNYGKDTRGYRVLRMILGNGLLTSQGDFWLRQRRIAQPGFNRERIGGFATTMTRATEDMLARWQPTIDAGGKVDLAHEMMKVTLQVVGATLLSIDTSDAADEVGEALTTGLEYTNYRITHAISAPRFIPTARNRDFERASGVLNGVVTGIIEQRRRSGEDKGDLLSMLMLARDEETGESMSDSQLRDEVMTLFLAGHETTAMTLTWACHLLAQHPEVEQRLRAELASVLGGRTPTLQDLKSLPYLDRVVKETMRLYPPAWIMGRNAIDEDVLGGYRVPRGAYVFISQFLTHRSERYWSEPNQFDPDRFLPERSEGRHKYAFFPFSAGQRKCIGDFFATIEAQLILATMLQKVQLRHVDVNSVTMEPLITLRPKGGMEMWAKAAPTVGASMPAPTVDDDVAKRAAAAGCPFHQAQR